MLLKYDYVSFFTPKTWGKWNPIWRTRIFFWNQINQTINQSINQSIKRQFHSGKVIFFAVVIFDDVRSAGTSKVGSITCEIFMAWPWLGWVGFGNLSWNVGGWKEKHATKSSQIIGTGPTTDWPFKWWWFSKGNPFISHKPKLVKPYSLASKKWVLHKFISLQD